MSLRVRQIVNNPVQSNCFIVYDPFKYEDCIVIDPGSNDNSHVEFFLSSCGLKPSYIIITHEHFDHCWGVDKIRGIYGSKLICSSVCSDRIQDAKKNLSLFYDQKGFEINAANYIISELGNKLEWHDNPIIFKETPGHTDSSISIIINNMIFTGDALIKDVRTVTKLLTGSARDQKITEEFFKSLKGKGFIIYPGHGDIFDFDSYTL